MSNRQLHHFIIDGNICSLKTTYLNTIIKKPLSKGIYLSYDDLINPDLELVNDNIEFIYVVLKEPTHKWTQSGLLDNFYKDIKKYAFDFQTCVFETYFEQIDMYESVIKNAQDKEVIPNIPVVLFIERSGIARWFVFTEPLHRQQILSDIDYQKLFDRWMPIIKQYEPTWMYWFKCDDQTCFDRISVREGKNDITQSYLLELEKAHEQFYLSKTHIPSHIKTNIFTTTGDPYQFNKLTKTVEYDLIHTFKNK
jgi:deoxyadenosine/deoxycytidine kinase